MRIRVYNFKRRWDQEVIPLLKESEELRDCAMGCIIKYLHDLKYNEDDKYFVLKTIQKLGFLPPAVIHDQFSRKMRGKRYHKYSLECYRWEHKCFWIEPFTRKLGSLIYPDHDWIRFASPRHAISVGTFKKEVVVMDILAHSWRPSKFLPILYFANPNITNQMFADKIIKSGGTIKDITSQMPTYLDEYLESRFTKDQLDWGVRN
jgi:hypothetical protein